MRPEIFSESADRRMKLKRIGETTRISEQLVGHTLHEILGMTSAFAYTATKTKLGDRLFGAVSGQDSTRSKGFLRASRNRGGDLDPTLHKYLRPRNS